MKSVIKLLRPKHWSKNLFLLLPVFFAGEFLNIDKLLAVMQGFICFSFAASGIYVINDIKDVPHDRLHPKKRSRPIASGEISQSTGILIAMILFALSLLWSYFLNAHFASLIITYIVINFAYTFGLKNIPILDLFIVATGFLLRVFSGGILAAVPVSDWLIIMVLLLSLFIILAKRRDDLVLSNGNNDAIIRKSSSHYNLEFINACLTMLSAVVVVAYIMYTMSEEVIQRLHSDYLFLSCVFVIAGVMRYMQIAIVEKKSGSPIRILLRDRFTLFTVLGWVIFFFLIIYIF